MSLTQQHLEMYKGYREDRRCKRCKRCNWFGHLAHNYKYKERVAAREQRGGLCENWWNTLRSKVMECEEDRKIAHSLRREVQQEMKCWGCGKVGHCLWACSNKVACPTRGVSATGHK